MRNLRLLISDPGRAPSRRRFVRSLRALGAAALLSVCAFGPSVAESPSSEHGPPASTTTAREVPATEAASRTDAEMFSDRDLALAPVEPEEIEVAAESAETDIETDADAGDEGDWEEEDAWEEDDWDDWDDELETVPSGYPDPLEPVNRVVLSFNNAIDQLVLDPVTQLYRFVLPDFSRAAIVRLFDNVNSPSVMINDALQLEWEDAAVCTSRLLVNSTLGLAGFMDPAADLGLDPHVSDFGQTLTLAGVPAGMYFVIPLLGPANARDAVGLGVDSFLHPTFYVLGGTDLLIFGGSAGLTSRARHYEEIQALKDSSVDIYSALRSGYYQNREAEIWSRREDRRADDSAAP